jgi:WD40 repeat protein
MDASARERVVFSEDGTRLAVCRPDGEVKVWNSATGTLSSSFTPEGARGVPVRAASWSRCVHKRRKSGEKIALAVGTKVIVWNELKGRQECVLSGVHTGPVTGMAWGSANACVYSASEDKHVAVWNTDTWEFTHKWQADRHGVKCICCHGNRGLVVTAGRTIKFWSSTDYTLVKKCSGHATSVCDLVFVGETLLLSCAHDDRVLNLWNAETKGSAAVASFTCEEEVTSCYVTVTMGMVHAAALTQDGVLHMFKYPLTNQIIAPISAHSTIQFASGQSQV